MTKGTGQAVLNQMVGEQILTLSGPMYYLDPEQLAAKAGVSYVDCMKRQYSQETIDFITRAVQNSD